MKRRTELPTPATHDTRDGEQWRNGAACRYEDPELFFPIGNSGPALLQIEEAKAVCRRCVVRQTCLEWAISDDGIDYGVAGGLTQDERRNLKRRIARNAPKPPKPQTQKVEHVTERAAAVLRPDATYTGAELLAVLNLTTGSGSIIGALLRAGMLEPAGKKPAWQGRYRNVPAYRMAERAS